MYGMFLDNFGKSKYSVDASANILEPSRAGVGVKLMETGEGHSNSTYWGCHEFLIGGHERIDD